MSPLTIYTKYSGLNGTWPPCMNVKVHALQCLTASRVSHPGLSRGQHCDNSGLLGCRRSFWLCLQSPRLQNATPNLKVFAWATGKPASVGHHSLAEHWCHHVPPTARHFEGLAGSHEPALNSAVPAPTLLYSAPQLRDANVGQVEQHCPCP